MAAFVDRKSWKVTLLGALLSAAFVHIPAHAIDVVVNSSVRMDSANSALLRGIFGKRVTAWPDGAPARVFVLSDQAPTHDRFSREILRMYPYQLRQGWDRLVFSGTGQAPTVVPSLRSMLDTVASTPGAVGYVDKFDAELFRNPNIRVLDVQ